MNLNQALKSLRMAPLVAALLLAACGTLPESSSSSAGSSGRLPYGKPVAGKPGMVTSPYTENNALIDVRGFPRGEQVSDPWTGQRFLVP